MAQVQCLIVVDAREGQDWRGVPWFLAIYQQYFLVGGCQKQDRGLAYAIKEVVRTSLAEWTHCEGKRLFEMLSLIRLHRSWWEEAFMLT